MHASGNLTTRSKSGFGSGAPQMPLSISELSFPGVEGGQSKPIWEGSDLQDQDISLWSPWLERKGGE